MTFSKQVQPLLCVSAAYRTRNQNDSSYSGLNFMFLSLNPVYKSDATFDVPVRLSFIFKNFGSRKIFIDKFSFSKEEYYSWHRQIASLYL